MLLGEGKMIDQRHSGIGDNNYINGDYYETIQRNPSILADIINELGNRLFQPTSESFNDFKEFNIEEKIKYNNVKRYKYIIDENKIYQGKLIPIYQELDEQGTSKKLFLFQNIKNAYLKAKSKYLEELNVSNVSEDNGGEIVIIRRFADDIIETVEKELLKALKESSNIHQSIEVVKVGLDIIIVDAFMRCKILEEPKKLC